MVQNLRERVHTYRQHEPNFSLHKDSRLNSVASTVRNNSLSKVRGRQEDGGHSGEGTRHWPYA